MTKKELVLQRLREAAGRSVSGQELARELGVSPLTILQDRDGSEILTAYTKGEVRA